MPREEETLVQQSSDAEFEAMAYDDFEAVREALLQDAANATLQSETLRRNCVRCNNRKRWCKKPVKKDAKRLRWRMHQTRFRFKLHVRCRAYGSVHLTICDEEEQKKRAAR